MKILFHIVHRLLSIYCFILTLPMTIMRPSNTDLLNYIILYITNYIKSHSMLIINKKSHTNIGAIILVMGLF